MLGTSTLYHQLYVQYWLFIFRTLDFVREKFSGGADIEETYKKIVESLNTISKYNSIYKKLVSKSLVLFKEPKKIKKIQNDSPELWYSRHHHRHLCCTDFTTRQ